MSLYITDPITLAGTNGVSGSNGANGTSTSPDGTDGTDGTSGTAASLQLANQTFVGDADEDVISLTREAVGGAGGNGGKGGRAAAADATSTTTSGADFSTTTVTHDAAGQGGLAGLAGLSGSASVLFATLDFDFGTTTPGDENTLRLTANAIGGAGGRGGSGGAGGSSGIGLTDIQTTTGPTFTTTLDQAGGAGIAGANGANGSNGSSARSTLAGITVTGDALFLTLSADATGGKGGDGYFGGTGGSGATGASGGNGGTGGQGGDALAIASGLSITAQTSLRMSINLTATGGEGGWAGGAGLSGTGTVTQTLNQSTYTTVTHAAASNGAFGGDGGAARAILRDSVISGTTGIDDVYIALEAYGNRGGVGSVGGEAVADSTTTLGDVVTEVFGTGPGIGGGYGVSGPSTIEMRGVSVNLRGGDDRLALNLVADGLSFDPGTETVLFSRNSFTGGKGHDLLDLGQSSSNEAAVIVNVQTGVLRIGTGKGNTFSGFEAFSGGHAADAFVDGVGDQSYSGGFDGDTFVFTSGRAGHDQVLDFQYGDVIAFHNFGFLLNSYADVLARTSDTAEGALIHTSATSTILLVGVAKAEIFPDHFSF